MRLGTVTTSAILSAALLSGCSFIGGQSSTYENPYAKQKAAKYGHYGQQQVGNRCQVPTPRHPVPRGCRPEQVTIGTVGQAQHRPPHAAQGGFPQQPQFGQPQYTNGAYGNAVGQSAAVAHHTTGPKKRKPKLRGSLSLGVERSVSGDLFAPSASGLPAYNPQDFNQHIRTGSEAEGAITDVTYLANDLIPAGQLNGAVVRIPGYERISTPAISFDDVWSTPASLKAGLEYIVDDNTTVFASGGYTYAEGQKGSAGSVEATIYQETIVQNYTEAVDANGNDIPGQFITNGGPIAFYEFVPNEQIATFTYDFSDLERYDLEVGARRYLKPLVKTDGYKTVTPFVGASVGVSHVNAVDFKETQTQAYYQRVFEGETEDLTYVIQRPDTITRLSDSQWLPQGQLNVGAEWQLTPGFAIAAETGVRIQGARDYVDFTNAAGDLVQGTKGDVNISIPLTLRGSVNF